MPVSPTYPGVYIDELPAALRTIAGVPTSITAFVGAAARGPLDRPRRIYNYGEYERIFGGLFADSDMSYTVQHYFANGGAVAEVVRVGGYSATDPKHGCATISCPTTSGATSGGASSSGAASSGGASSGGASSSGAASSGGGSSGGASSSGTSSSGTSSSADPLELVAASPGSWGAKLAVYIDYKTSDTASTTLYNLTVKDTGTGYEEQYRNLSTSASSPDWIENRIGASRLIANVSGGDKQPKASPVTPPSTQPDPYVPTAGTAMDIAPAETNYTGSEDDKTGIYALLKTDIFNLLCLPGVASDVLVQAAALCLKRRAILVMDPLPEWTNVQQVADVAGPDLADGARNAAVYYPRVMLPDPLQGNNTRPFAPCGAVPE